MPNRRTRSRARVRVERDIALPLHRRVSGFLDLFKRDEEQRRRRADAVVAGPSFSRPTSILPPRALRIGACVE
ncbi:MAG TPA: hypothetical protein VKE51_08015 [Vicinamibacterales bacterium]|nr:hypothetical protein [Vicinamibacterales bacterium]